MEVQYSKEQNASIPNVPPPPYTPKADPGSAYPQAPPPAGFVPYVNPSGESVPTITVIRQIQFDSKSQMVNCGHCGVQGMSKIKVKPNSMTHTIALILFCFVCWPCAWIPYTCDSCQSIHHYCSNCNSYLGEHRE